MKTNTARVVSLTQVETGRFYSVEDVQSLFRMKRSKVYALVRCGQLRSVRFGKLIRIPGEAILELVNEAA